MLTIPQDNDFTVHFPLYHNGQPLAAADITDIVVRYSHGDQTSDPLTFATLENNIVVGFPETLELGTYHIHITAKWQDADIASHLHNAIRIVRWNEQSDFHHPDPFVADVTNFTQGNETSLIDNITTLVATNASQQQTIVDQQAAADQSAVIASQQQTINGQQDTIGQQQRAISDQQTTIESQQHTIAAIEGRVLAGVVTAEQAQQHANNIADTEFPTDNKTK